MKKLLLLGLMIVGLIGCKEKKLQVMVDHVSGIPAYVLAVGTLDKGFAYEPWVMEIVSGKEMYNKLVWVDTFIMIGIWESSSFLIDELRVFDSSSLLLYTEPESLWVRQGDIVIVYTPKRLP